MFLLILENPQFASRNLQYVCDYRQGLNFLFSKQTQEFAHCDKPRVLRAKRFFFLLPLFTYFFYHTQKVFSCTKPRRKRCELSENKLKQMYVVCVWERWWNREGQMGDKWGGGGRLAGCMDIRHSHTYRTRLHPRPPPHWQRCVLLFLKERKASPGSPTCLGAQSLL